MSTISLPTRVMTGPPESPEQIPVVEVCVAANVPGHVVDKLSGWSIALGLLDEEPDDDVRPYPSSVTTRLARAHSVASFVVARREMLAPGISVLSTRKAMSSAAEFSPRFVQPSTVMIALWVMVCGDCWVSTPGKYTESGRVVTVPSVVTTQCAAVITMRLVHNAPLHTLLALMIRTTAVLPNAEAPPTMALARDVGKATIVALRTTVKATRVICRKLANMPRTHPDYDAWLLRR